MVLQLKVVLKWREIYIENIRVLSLVAGHKIDRILEWWDHKWQGSLYRRTCLERPPYWP